MNLHPVLGSEVPKTLAISLSIKSNSIIFGLLSLDPENASGEIILDPIQGWG